jgi:glycine cleavage system aminomethyltransferase T
LLGPAHGLRGYWVFCGEMAGFFRSSAARYLAEWIISGEPGIDLSALDVRRFDPNMSKQHAVDRLMSGHIYSLPVYYPHTEPGGGRNFKRTALHLRLGQRGAVFGEQNGWEVPNWFCGEKPDAADEPSLNHANWFGAVAAECRAARDHVALIDLGSLAKFKIEGPGAAAWLDWLLTSRLPDVGHSKNAHCLTSGGRLAASFLVSRLSEQSFYLTDFAVNEQRDEDWLVKTAPSRGVSIANVTVTTAAIGIFGPKSRLLLQSLTEQSLSNDNFHRLALHEIHIGGIGVTAIRHSLTGELGFELHVDADAQATLYEKLVEAGQAHSVVDAGWRALDSLRLEKGWRRSGTDYALAAEPSSAGVTLDIAPGKGEFLGRSALEDCRERSRVPVTLLIDTGAAPVAPWGEETVLVDGVHTAFTSSGGYGHRVESAIALASIPGNLVSAQTVEVEILGKRYAARIETRAAYDPGGLRMRS